MTDQQRAKTQISHVRNKRGSSLTTVSTNKKRIIKKRDAGKLVQLGRMNTFLDRYKVPELTQEVIDNVTNLHPLKK